LSRVLPGRDLVLRVVLADQLVANAMENELAVALQQVIRREVRGFSPAIRPRLGDDEEHQGLWVDSSVAHRGLPLLSHFVGRHPPPLRSP
jgi:hypothetical protein